MAAKCSRRYVHAMTARFRCPAHSQTGLPRDPSQRRDRSAGVGTSLLLRAIAISLIAALSAQDAPAQPSDEAPLEKKATPDGEAADGSAAANATDAGVLRLARELQDPLTQIKAIITENQVLFDNGPDDRTAYRFQIQPLYAFDFPEHGFSLLPRGVIPIVGLPQAPAEGNGETTWGLADTFLQLFVAPDRKGAVQWGLGPQFSIPTATASELRSIGWGSGVSGVVTGYVNPQLSLALVLGNVWSFERNQSILTAEPGIFYNLPGLPGGFVSYDATVSAEWTAPGPDVWTVPIGLSYTQAFLVGSGNGAALSAGPYYNVVRPRGEGEWALRFSLSWIWS